MESVAWLDNGSDYWSDYLLDWADRHRRWLMGILLVFYAGALNGQWRIEPDAALYLTVARNIADGRGFTYHDRPETLVYPGLPYAMAAIMRVAPGSLVPENLLMPLVGLAALGLAYRMIRLNAGRPTAVVVVFCLGLTRTFHRAAFSLLTDMPFLLGAMAFLAGYERIVQGRQRRGIHWLAILAGCALMIVMRPTWMVFVPIAALAIIAAAASGKIHWKTAAAVVVAIALEVVVFYTVHPRRAGNYENLVYSRVQPNHLALFLSTAGFNTIDLLRQYTASALLGSKFGPSPDAGGVRHWYDAIFAGADVAVAAAIWVTAVTVVRRRALWAVWIAATMVTMVIFLALERYFLPALPLMVLGEWLGIRWVNHRLRGGAGNIAVAVLLGLMLAPNIAQDASLIIEQHRTPFLAHYRGGKFLPMVAAARAIARLPADAVVVSPLKTGRIYSYFSGRTVVEPNEVALVIGWPIRGRPVYIINDPADEDFQRSLVDLGITRTSAIAEVNGAAVHDLQMGRLELRALK